ncbi:Protein C23H3.2 b, partial [Aphelenchoides avenae]
EFKAYKRKVDRRIGIAVICCLATICTILFIYGLIHSTGYDILAGYLGYTKKVVEDLKMPTGTFTSTGATPSVHGLRVSDVPENNGSALVGTDIPLAVSGDVLNTFRTLADDPKWLTIREIDVINESLTEVHIAIWNLAALNLIFLMLITPLTVLFFIQYFDTPYYKLIYRACLLFTLFFMLAQLTFLIDPLFVDARTFPDAVDRLFVDAEPKHLPQMQELEQKYSCVFNPNELLLRYKLQEPCVPKLKNYLLPAYTVVLLIFVDLFPIAYAIWIYAWDACVKDINVIREARSQMDMSGLKRPHTREEIINGTLGSEASSV